MKVKRSLVITALVLFAMNIVATAFSGLSAVIAMRMQAPLLSTSFLWTIFNALVGVIVAVMLTVACVLCLKGKGELLAAGAFFLCAVQNFLSFIPNVGLYPVKMLLLSVTTDWLCAFAYLAIAITAILKWRGRITGIIGAGIVLSVRCFAMIRTIIMILRAQVNFLQIAPTMLANFLFCILCLNLGILLLVLAQKKKNA